MSFGNPPAECSVMEQTGGDRPAWKEWDWIHWRNDTEGWSNHHAAGETRSKRYLGYSTDDTEPADGSTRAETSTAKTASQEPGIHICFLPRVETLASKHSSFCKHLSKQFNIPELFWTNTGIEGNGYFWAKHDPATASKKHRTSTVSRYLVKEVNFKDEKERDKMEEKEWYKWQFLGFASWWSQAEVATVSPTTIFLCFDVAEKNGSDWHYSSAMMDRIESCLKAREDVKTMQYSPYGMYAMMMEPVLYSFDEALWGFRTPVRRIEKNRLTVETATDKKYHEMHELSRHIIHASETIEAAAKAVKSIIKCHDRCPKTVDSDGVHVLVEDSFHFYANFFAALKLRAQAFEDRLLNEIQFAHHVVGAKENLTQRDILQTQEQSLLAVKGVLEALKDDGRMLARLVSYLTIVFLPGSVVASFFGMNVLAFSPDETTSKRTYFTWYGWQVSVFVVIPFAVTIALIILCGLLLYYNRLLPALPEKKPEDGVEQEQSPLEGKRAAQMQPASNNQNSSSGDPDAMEMAAGLPNGHLASLSGNQGFFWRRRDRAYRSGLPK